MFLFDPIHFLTFSVKSQPQRSHKKGSYIKKKKSVSRLDSLIKGGRSFTEGYFLT